MKVNNITKYLRSAISAQSNMSIDFKTDKYYSISKCEFEKGFINKNVCKEIFDENKNKNKTEVIICTKTIRTIFSENKKINNDIDELTGVFFIPCSIKQNGELIVNKEENKLPWFPRNYLVPIIESVLSVGDINDVNKFMSDNVDTIDKIKSWDDYMNFSKNLYEKVSQSNFEENYIQNIFDKNYKFELEEKMYIFIDKTVNSIFHILNLYNDLLKDDKEKLLYNKFLSLQIEKDYSLIENSIENMEKHCGQMGGEYPLAESQREAINHFNNMLEGEILAINGPPGTGKTTLLQSIVADMYVKRALNKEKAPIIIASSTNNQAVTNIINSFGNIKTIGISNLEERWIDKVNSFATYFPSSKRYEESRRLGYQYTNKNGEFFISKIDDIENLKNSKLKLIDKCNEYFLSNFTNVDDCQEKIYGELKFLEKYKSYLINIYSELKKFDFGGKNIHEYQNYLNNKIEENEKKHKSALCRIDEWEKKYKSIPFITRMLSFINIFKKKINVKLKMFLNPDEQKELQEDFNFNDIMNLYSKKIREYNSNIIKVKEIKNQIAKIIKRITSISMHLQKSGVILFKEYDESLSNFMNIDNLIDTKIRYIEFWLAVHYYECRWVSGEDALTEKQKGKTFENVLKKLYNRLAMVTPCFVMTFYMLPKQFVAYVGQNEKNKYMYNFADLLIVDEAGQVSPEIAAGAFSIAKKAVIVGDIHQIEPVWNLNRVLDKSLAIDNSIIEVEDNFEYLETIGLNCSNSSVMKLAANRCKYRKFDDKGLFLSEHRRCYNEIIDYCNKLVYKGNLTPMRGKGSSDRILNIKNWPQMGYKQIDSESSIRKGTSRINKIEAKEIAIWLKNNIDYIIRSYSNEETDNLIGVITPFKSQVKYLKDEIKKLSLDKYINISVGTVHTFQGTERRIIILSTVYGSQDGCFFIDTNKSLMNVAVSRAKDFFFVFGDLNCLKNSKTSASGLLKNIVISNPM